MSDFESVMRNKAVMETDHGSFIAWAPRSIRRASPRLPKSAGAKGRRRQHPRRLASRISGHGGSSRDAITNNKTRAGRRSGRVLSIFLWPYRTGSRGYLYRGTHPTCTRPEGNELKTSGDFRAAAAGICRTHRHHPRATAKASERIMARRLFLCSAKQNLSL